MSEELKAYIITRYKKGDQVDMIADACGESVDSVLSVLQAVADN